jgi:hypothetical protein
MGDLAQIEHQQKLQRIRSGVRAAQSAGKWTGRPPAGFVVEDGYLRVDPAEFLHIREALVRVDRGEPFASVADDTGIAESTLRSLHQDRRDLYLGGEAEDKRVDDALTNVRPLEDAWAEDPNLEELRERVEAIFYASKRRFGGTLRARTWFGQFRELVLKATVRNIEQAVSHSQP